MSIKVENTLNEIQMAGGYYSAKPITTTATGTFAALAVTGTVSFASAGVTGAATVGGTLGVTGLATFNGGLTATATTTLPATTIVGAARVIVGTLNQPAGPTGVTAPTGSIFLSAVGGTGPATRAFINADGATSWIAITTAS